MGRLQGRRAVVTGASGGIGRAIALALAREGADQVLVARREGPLQEVAAQVRAHRVRAWPVPADISDDTQAEEAIARAGALLDGLDLLVCSAGVGAFASVVETKVGDWDRMMAVNLRGTFLCCRAALRLMLPQRAGQIINIVSLAGLRVFPEEAAYCASKFGALGFTKALAEEVRPAGVRVTAVCPGAVDTPFWDTVAHGLDRRKMLAPEDVAEAVVAVAVQPPRALTETVIFAPSQDL